MEVETRDKMVQKDSVNTSRPSAVFHHHVEFRIVMFASLLQFL